MAVSFLAVNKQSMNVPSVRSPAVLWPWKYPRRCGPHLRAGAEKSQSIKEGDRERRVVELEKIHHTFASIWGNQANLET